MRAFLFLALAGLISLPARADLTWTLNGVTFDDGGTATGFLTFLTGGGETWSITVSGGNTADFPDFTFDNASSSYKPFDPGQIFIEGPSFTRVDPQEPNGITLNRVLLLVFSAPSPTSGPVNIPLAIGGNNPSRETYNAPPARFATAGSIDVSGSLPSFAPLIAPPALSLISEPSSFGLGLLALSGFLGLRRRRNSSAPESPSRSS